MYTYIKNEISAFTGVGNWLIWKYPEQAAKNFADLIRPLAELAVINQPDASPALSPVRIRIPGRPYIIGRVEQLQLLHNRISTNHPFLLVNGLGGIGKTTIAQEYVNDPRYSNDYAYIAWVTVDRDIKQSLILALQPAFPVDLSACRSLEEQFAKLSLYLENLPGKKLLVLDNVNDQKELVSTRYQLESLHWYVLITTRCEPDEMEKLPVDELPAADACELFLHYYRKTAAELSGADRGLLAQLLKQIHFHTLLTELLAKAGFKKGLSLTEIGERLNQADYRHKDFQRTIPAGSHAESAQKDREARLHDYILALFEPEKLAAHCKQYVRLFSILPPVDISFAHLKHLFAVDNDTENDFEDLLAELAGQGWINCKNQTCKMHPLVQDVAREKLQPDPENCALLVTTLTALMQQSATSAYEYLLYAKTVTEKIIVPDDSIASLLIDFSDACLATGNIQQALESIRQSHNILEQSNDRYQLSVAYERSGKIYQVLGQFDKALQFFKLRTQLGKELYEANPKSMELMNGMAVSLYKLGALYLEKKQQAEGIDYLQQALELWEKLFANTKLNQFKGYIEHVKALIAGG